MGVRGLLRSSACACLLALGASTAASAQDPTVDPGPVPAPPQAAPTTGPPDVRVVDRTYRASRTAIEIRGDVVTIDGADAIGPLQRRLRTPVAVRATVACSDDVVDLDPRRPRPGIDYGGDDVVTPDPATATVHLTVPGLAQRVAADADGCRAVIAEPAGYRVGTVAAGFTQEVRRALYTQSLRTTARDRQALAAAEAGVTSALTYYVSHGSDLRGWQATDDGRVPGEAILRLGTAVSLGAVALMPATDDIVRMILPPGRARARHQLTLVVPSTAVHERLIVVERDFATGLVRYSVLDRDLKVRYRSARPPFAACSDPLDPSRCTDPKNPNRPDR